MSLEVRPLLRALSVAAFATVVLAALVVGPRSVRSWLLVSGLIGAAMSVSSVVAEPRELLVALLFSLPPVAALAAEGSPGWLMGPLASMLLLGAELNAWSWGAAEPHTARPVGRARLHAVSGLVAGSLLASLLVSWASRFTLFDRGLAVAVGAASLATLGWLLLPGRSSLPAAHVSAEEAGQGE